MLDLSQAAKIASNQLESAVPWLTFLTITSPDTETIYIVRNNEDIIWNGTLYTRFPVEIDTLMNDDGKTLNSVNLKVSNAGKIIQDAIQSYNGLCDAEVQIDVVYMETLTRNKNAVPYINIEPEDTFSFIVTQTTYDEQWVTFKLGARTTLAHGYPMHKFYLEYCPFVFGDIRCGYAGGGEPCKNTLSTCKILERFGGSFGING